MKFFTLRFSLCLAFFFTLLTAVEAQGPWTQRATMPGTARHRAFTFSIGQRGYFGCGWNGITMYSDFWEYDPGSDTWVQKANYPGGPRLSAFGFSVGNKGYAGTGLEATATYAQNDFYEYNPATNQWTMKSPFPGTAVFGATATVWNGTALILFGDDWSPNYWKHNEIYAYDAPTDTWTYVGVFPGDGRRDHVAFNIGNKIYFGTGNDNNYTELNDWWEWNPGTGSMIPKANFPGSSRSQAVGFAVNGKGYVGTGGALDERDFFEYNAITDTWQGIDEFPGSGRENSMSFVIGARAFLVAGTSGINYHDCWEFNSALVTGTSEQLPVLSVAVYPNPAVDYFTINYEGNAGTTAEFILYDMQGAIVFEQIIGEGKTEVLRGEWASGVYPYSITGANGIKSSGSIVFH